MPRIYGMSCRAGGTESRSEVGNCLGRQAYWSGKLCQGKKGEGKSKKLRKVKKEKKERDEER